ncbi:hypothetical protein AYK24_08870 [Thermoplasmatales archaeon SG8-52-4]|nr:MAG: hypothetical protein AYK24_08870 [Thermoplasmatales archaeon SG8-52-4]
MNIKAIIAVILVVIIVVPVYLIYFNKDDETTDDKNKKPIVEIIYPQDNATVSNIVMISGTATDPDGDDNLLSVEIMIYDRWILTKGNTRWSYEWITYDMEDGYYSIQVRSWDGKHYSDIKQLNVNVYNPDIVESDAHKWAVFIAASNFPNDNESKLGNGALNLAEQMAAYFIQDLSYSTNNIFILFDDGWIRQDNGYGEPYETLQERTHEYDITYAGTNKETVRSVMNYIVEKSNKFDDSEVFIWIASHGCGNEKRKFFGGKLFERSAIYLWDDTFTDRELGNILSNLKSHKTCVIVDACYSGGFADKTIFNKRESIIFKSGIPGSGRVVMSGASKYRLGYASTTQGPLFSQLWFKGIITGKADGFRPFIFKIGRPTILKFFKDGKVSVEEAFYYARYILRTEKIYEKYDKMEPQINDRYPRWGLFGSFKGLILGN